MTNVFNAADEESENELSHKEVQNLIEASLKGKLHSKRVEKMQNHTRNEWRRFKTTLETSGEDHH